MLRSNVIAAAEGSSVENCTCVRVLVCSSRCIVLYVIFREVEEANSDLLASTALDASTMISAQVVRLSESIA